MTSNANFQKNLEALNKEWPPSERYLIHDAAARRLGDMIQQHPDKLDAIVEIFGSALRRSNAQHVGVLWTCMRVYGPEHSRKDVEQRFLEYLGDRRDSLMLRSLAIGVVKPAERSAFFQDSWPMMKKHLAHEHLTRETVRGLMSGALTDFHVGDILSQILDEAQLGTDDVKYVMEYWIRAVTHTIQPLEHAQSVLDQLLKAEKQDVGKLLDDMLLRAGQLVESFSPDDLATGKGGQAIECLVTAGARWERLDPNQYPGAWTMIVNHPRWVAAQLEKLAGPDAEGGRLLAPKRQM